MVAISGSRSLEHQPAKVWAEFVRGCRELHQLTRWPAPFEYAIVGERPAEKIIARTLRYPVWGGRSVREWGGPQLAAVGDAAATRWMLRDSDALIAVWDGSSEDVAAAIETARGLALPTVVRVIYL